MAMTLNGEDMFVRCHDHEARLLRRKLVQLKATLNDTKAKADKIKVTLLQYVRISNDGTLLQVSLHTRIGLLMLIYVVTCM